MSNDVIAGLLIGCVLVAIVVFVAIALARKGSMQSDEIDRM